MTKPNNLSAKQPGKLPAKLTRPRLAKVYLRKRLIKLLDDGQHAPVVWIEAPPGAGKTTLAASWLDEREHPCLWYQIDARDTDIATFFHYLGIAARHAAPCHKRALPHLTPEYLKGIEAFTRRYFEALFERLAPNSVLVLDNVQDAGIESPLYPVLRTAFETVPGHVRVACLSRTTPPPELARLRANGQLTVIGPEDLRLSLEETLGFAALHSGTDRATAHIHERTGGWAAGIVLMLEAGKQLNPLERRADTPQALFDYFAAEIWQQTGAPARRTLAYCALLPGMLAEEIETITASPHVAKTLADFRQRNYFTYQLASDPPTYDFHPLFREFLLSRARQELPPHEISRVRINAARVLEDGGRIEEAMHLIMEAADWDGAARLLLAHAPEFAAQGRSKTLEAWLMRLPAKLTGQSPWLTYWLGRCRMFADPYAGRQYLINAFDRFKSRADLAGMLSAWISISETIQFGWGEPRARWISEFDQIVAAHPVFPSPEIEARAVINMFALLMLRDVGRDDIPLLEQKVSALFAAAQNVALRYRTAHLLVIYHLWMGDFGKGIAIQQSLKLPDIPAHEDPVSHLSWYDITAQCAWMSGDFDACIHAVEAGLELAANSGVHIRDLFFYKYGIAGAASLGHIETASNLLQRMSALHLISPMDKSFYHYLSGLVAWKQGRLSKAVEDGKMAVTVMGDLDYCIGPYCCHMTAAVACYDQQEWETALHHLAATHRLAAGRNYLDYISSLFSARVALDQGKDEECLAMLRHALSLGARHGYVNFPWWDAAAMSRLCAVALAHGIETSYVRGLIRRRRLAPPADSPSSLDAWPWPLKICTLGEFAIYRDGEPVRFTGKVQRRPLALLKTLVALGGRAVPEARLAEALWPDADGDVAHANLRPALHRLRKLIGADALRAQDGRLSLDPRHCWVDADAIERLLDEVPGLAAAPADARAAYLAARHLFTLYSGPFLDGEDMPEAITLRERLRARLLRHAYELGESLRMQGAWAEAVSLYEWGIAADPCAEQFYRGLMHCHAALHQSSDVLRVYERCRDILKSRFNLDPSPETQALARTTQPSR